MHLLRHGEVHNPDRVLYGRLPDYHLSTLGRQMALLAAKHLADHDITHIVSSPLERARETASPVAEMHGLPVTLDERVIEASENVFEGLQVAGGQGLLKHRRCSSRRGTPSARVGEPYVELAARMKAAIDDVRAAARGHEAVIVSHQAPIWTVRCAYEGRRFLHDPRKRECTLASLTSLTWVGDDLLGELQRAGCLPCSPWPNPEPVPDVTSFLPEPPRAATLSGPSRRGAFTVALGAASLAPTACSSDPNSIAEQAKRGDQKGYVSGDGSIERIAAGERKGPVTPVRLDDRRGAPGRCPTTAGPSSSSTSGVRGVPRVWPRLPTCSPCGRRSRPTPSRSSSSASTSAGPRAWPGLRGQGRVDPIRASPTSPACSSSSLQGKAPTVPTTLVLDPRVGSPPGSPGPPPR